MFYVPTLLGSTRRGRMSERVARFLVGQLQQTGKAQTELIDLAELNLPIMEERLHERDDPPPGLVGFGERVGKADALLIVTPEYNGGYPGVLKNALDYLYPEYRRKPVGIATVSNGPFGGMNCLALLRPIFLRMGAVPIPASFPVPRVQDAFEADGTPKDPAYPKRAQSFLAELLWYTEALSAQKAKDLART